MRMLDEREFHEVTALFKRGARSLKEYRERTGAPLKGLKLATYFEEMLMCYESITGFKETNPNAVWHHRLSLHGPPCRHCGKPLRSPQAKLCGNCMASSGQEPDTPRPD